MKKLSILFAAFAVVFLASCGKYEDGPGFSLRSKNVRATGEWIVESAIQGGVDVTSNVTLGGTLVLTLAKDGTYSKKYSYTILGQVVNNTVTGTWNLSDDKASLEMTDASGTLSSSKILRLTNKELWVQESDGSGGTYDIHYKAK